MIPRWLHRFYHIVFRGRGGNDTPPEQLLDRLTTPRLERLECRVVPALAASFSGVTLTVWSDAAGDTILFGAVGGQIYVSNGATAVPIAGAAPGLPTVATTALILVFANGGNDTVYADVDMADANSFVVVSGGAGNDVLAQAGPDGSWMTGDDGDDFVTGGGANDRLYGAAGADSILGNSGNDYLEGGEIGDSNDAISAGDGNDSVYGGPGSDTIDGGAGNDLVDAGNGNDYADGRDGNNTLLGATGNDTSDTLVAGAGADILNGGAGTDYLAGGGGDDFYHADDGEADTLETSTGDQFLIDLIDLLV